MDESERSSAGAGMRRDEDEEAPVIPVIEEELVTGTRPVRTGSVTVQKHVEKSRKRVEAPLVRDEVEVRHVPVNRVVRAVPEVRQSGDTIIVPVVEEELVITKRLVLKEEIHLVRRRTKERVSRDVELNRERAVVERTDAEGRVIEDPGVKPRKRVLPNR